MQSEREPDGSIIGKILIGVSAPIIVGATGLFLQQQANFARLDERMSQIASDVVEIKSDNRQQWASLDSRVRQLEIGYQKAGF